MGNPDDRGTDYGEEKVCGWVPAEHHEDADEKAARGAAEQRSERHVTREPDGAEEEWRGEEDGERLNEERGPNARREATAAVKAQEHRLPRAHHAGDARQRHAQW